MIQCIKNVVFEGVFEDYGIPGTKDNFKRIYAYTNENVEVIALYNTENSFVIKYIAIQLSNFARKNITTMYDVFSCSFETSSDDEVRVIIKAFAENVILYRMTLISFVNSPVLK